MNSQSDMWNEICFLLSENFRSSFSEKDFENQVVRALEVLGWREFRSEIERQPTIQLGREGTLRPDLIIYGQDKRVLIVLEVKHPSVDIAQDNTIGQLRSYMRQKKSEFGFLVGSEIRVYYDGPSNPQQEPLLLEKIAFDRGLPEGEIFVNNFNKNSFLNNKYSQYLEDKIKNFNKERERSKLMQMLISEDTKQKVIDFLRKEFADYGDESFSVAMNNLILEIKNKKEPISYKTINNKTSTDSIRSTRGNKIPALNHNRVEPGFTVNTPEDAKKILTMHFDSHLAVRLRQIYGVLYFMKKGYDFPSSTHQTLELFPDVQHYQTISDKCARRFAGSVDTFVLWFKSDEILNKLLQKLSLSDYDYKIFEKLLSS